MFASLLIANRGEIACRIVRTARAMGVRTIAVHSEADAGALHTELADQAVEIGPAPARSSYLDQDAILAAADSTGAEAIHPGYGFLSEHAGFARAVIDAGITWVGPAPETIEAVGDKRAARDLMAAAGVPVNAGAPVESAQEAVEVADRIGYPVIVKAAAGGGGIGMRIVHDSGALPAAFEATRDQAARFFGDGGMLLERFLDSARHVEIQVLGLPDGRVVVLGDRDCSVQRRHQKVVEEAPAPALSDELRRRMAAAVRAGAEAIGYRNAGTFECLVADDDFVFLEVNARLQVEHPVTEAVTGIDLVAAQLRVAAGEPVDFDPDDVVVTGHAIEFRLYAEDPKRFLPRPGRLEAWDPPQGPGVRVDSGVRAGDAITPHYDPMLAKLIVHGADRDQALARARAAVADFDVGGTTTNLDFLAEVLDNAEFATATHDTNLVARMRA